MRQTNLSRPQSRWTALRVDEATVVICVAMAVGLGVGLAALAVDTAWLWPPPVEFGTVAAARVLMGSVASGLITVAVFGLWMRTVVVGIMAAHFSPRTLLLYLEDRFQRNLLVFMLAGIVTVLVILLGMPDEEQAAAPLVSTVLVVVIVLAAITGVLLAIQDATRSLSMPELVSQLAENALEVLDRLSEERLTLNEVPPPEPTAQTVLAPGTGWVTRIDIDRIRNALPVGGVVHLRTRVGEFVTPPQPCRARFLLRG